MRDGFTPKFHKRLVKQIERDNRRRMQQPQMPPQITAGFAALLNDAVAGNTAQMELKMGLVNGEQLKVRVIMLRDESKDFVGEVVDGKRTLVVNDDLGEMIEVMKK